MTGIAEGLATQAPQRGGGPIRSRSILVRAGIVLAFSLLALQLWRLQVVEAPFHGRAAEENRLRLVPLKGPRGVIYDRSGHLLASNAPAFAVSVVEADLPREQRHAVLEKLAELLGTSTDELERLLHQRSARGNAFAPVPLRSHLPKEIALAIEDHSWELPGVQVTVESTREYAEGELLAHVLGYLVQPSAEEYERKYRAEGYDISDRAGASGAEATYESTLRGSVGGRLLEVDVSGRPLREVQSARPEPGSNLQLTIDLPLQRAVGEILRTRLPPGSSGVAIVMDPRNGEILTLLSLPSFDANVFSRPDSDPQVQGLIGDSRLPLFNRAIAGQYPPGSTFKLVVGVGALQEGVVNRSTRIRSDGGLRVPNPYDPRRFTWFPDWAALGDLNFVQGLALSSNVYFATLAGGFGDFRGLEEDRLARYARLLGYGDRTGIDLPSEEAGRVPTPAWKLANFAEGWFTGDTYNMAIGQGFVLATPLQVAAVTNAIANGGTLVRPHVGRALLDQEGRVLRSFIPPTRELQLRRDVLPLMREAMLETLNTSQLASQRLPQVRVAGKTGTAEFLGPRDARGNLPTHAWFTAFAPYEAPEVAVTVFVERGGSSTNAVPIAMEIIRAYLDLRDGSRR